MKIDNKVINGAIGALVIALVTTLVQVHNDVIALNLRIASIDEKLDKNTYYSDKKHEDELQELEKQLLEEQIKEVRQRVNAMIGGV